MEDLIGWEEEMVKRMVEKGLSEDEAWSRVEKIHIELIKEESNVPWIVREIKENAKAILKGKGWDVRYVGWHGNPDEWFYVKFEVLKEGEPLDWDYDWSLEERNGKKFVRYYWWY